MKNLSKITCLAALGLALTASSTAFAATCGGCCATATPMADAAKPDAAVKPYPLDTCIVSGEKLDADPGMKSYTFVHEGQEIKLCCKNCLKKFNKSPETYLKKLASAPKK
jgi:YHS domain-containing protein